MGFLLVIALFPLLVAEKLGTMNRERERGKLADFSVIFFVGRYNILVSCKILSKMAINVIGVT